MFKLYAMSNVRKEYICVDHGSLVELISQMIRYQDAYIVNNIGVTLLSHKHPS